MNLFTMNVTDESCGYCFIKDIVAYSEALSADDILKNTLYYIEKDEVNGYRNQKIKYDFNFNNTSLPKIQISADQADLDKMTLELPEPRKSFPHYVSIPAEEVAAAQKAWIIQKFLVIKL